MMDDGCHPSASECGISPPKGSGKSPILEILQNSAFDLTKVKILSKQVGFPESSWSALIAATWHRAGIQEVFTLNPADFAIFGAFAFSPPLDKMNDS